MSRMHLSSYTVPERKWQQKKGGFTVSIVEVIENELLRPSQLAGYGSAEASEKWS